MLRPALVTTGGVSPRSLNSKPRLSRGFFVAGAPTKNGTASSLQCSPYMSSRADMYRQKATDAKNRAAQARNPFTKSAFEEVAACWRVLAEQMEWIDKKEPFHNEKNNR
jgi:hypothetical protein